MNVRDDQIRIFITLAKHNSFAEAAEELYISAPALIQQMNTLENSLGFKLFTRTNKGISLTESGSVFFERVLTIYHDWENLVQECRERAAVEKKIRIGTYNSWHYTYLYRMLFDSFHVLYPDIELEFIPITRETALNDCQKHKFDISLTSDGEIAKKMGFTVIKIPPCSNVALLSNSHKFSKREKVHSSELSGETFIIEKAFATEDLKQWLHTIPDIRVEERQLSYEDVFHGCNQGKIFLIPSRNAIMIQALTQLIITDAPLFNLYLFAPKVTSLSEKTFLKFAADYLSK